LEVSVHKSAVIFFLIFQLLFWIVDVSHADQISAGAYINLRDPPNDIREEVSTSPDTSVSVSAQYGDQYAEARADTILELGTHAFSKNFSLSYPSIALAYFGWRFDLLGNPVDESIPLTISLGFEGSLSASSSPGVGLSVANSRMSYELYTPGGHGSANLQSINGIPTWSSSGAFSSHQGIKASVTSKIYLAPDFSGELLPEDFDYLSIDLDLETFETDYALAAGIIVNALELFGLPRLGILPGVKAGIAFDINYLFNSKVRITTGVRNEGSFLLNIQSSASTTAIGAESQSSFLNTVRIESITVPYDFDLFDPSNLLVVFDSGLSVEVTRAPNPVCEADFDHDGDIDGLDLSRFSNLFPSDISADLNRDLEVDFKDLSTLAIGYGQADCQLTAPSSTDL
jgi:hypothetical protein